jgi:hypothetical protein
MILDGQSSLIGPEKGLHLLHHPDLDWQGHHSLRTAAVDERRPIKAKFGPKQCMTATHYPVTGTTYVHGSVHSFYQEGENWQDLNTREANDAIRYFSNWIGVQPDGIAFRRAEFGLAFAPPTTTQAVTDRIICNWTGNPFVPMHAERGAASVGKELRMSDYRLKGYDKAQRDPRMRIEKAYTRSRELHKQGLYTMADLLKSGAWDRRAEDLLDTFDELVIFDPVFTTDPDIADDPEFLASIASPLYWKTLERTKRSRQRARLRHAFERNPSTSLVVALHDRIFEQAVRLAA